MTQNKNILSILLTETVLVIATVSGIQKNF